MVAGDDVFARVGGGVLTSVAWVVLFSIEPFFVVAQRKLIVCSRSEN